MKLVRRILMIAVVAAVAGFIVYAFLPQPVEVDAEPVTRGPLMVTVNEDGKTRIKERFVVSMPLAGQLRRIELKAGDPVAAGQTLLAVVLPNNPDLLDPRARAEAEARVSAFDAAVKRAETNLQAADQEQEHADTEYERIRRLREMGASSESALQDALFVMRAAREQQRSVGFSLDMARFELEQAQAALKRFQVSPEDPDPPGECQFEIHSPIDGRVLRILQESAAALPAGTPLMELGDPTNLELEIDVLSTDAVKIAPGDTVLVEHWGGETPLTGTVRVVEPAAFTKISALGVEEQRVWIIADLNVSQEERGSLGDAFRFEGRIVVWESEDVLQVPTSALFRQGDEWAVFVINDEHAHLRKVKLGHRNPDAAEVLDGLTEGERAIVYPSDRVQDGVAVKRRHSP
jgi:HlyD family secretion protein